MHSSNPFWNRDVTAATFPWNDNIANTIQDFKERLFNSSKCPKSWSMGQNGSNINELIRRSCSNCNINPNLVLCTNPLTEQKQTLRDLLFAVAADEGYVIAKAGNFFTRNRWFKCKVD